MIKSNRLDEVLHAAWNIVYCTECDCNGKKDSPLGALIGVMDWVAELHRLIEGGKLAMEDPNKRQVGGHHYKLTGYQHWDLMADNFGAPYFQAAVTKYISRWREKEGVKDLEKARHYAEKLLSLHQENRVAYRGQTLNNFDKFITTYKPGPLEREICYLAMTYHNEHGLLYMLDLIAQLADKARHAANQPSRPVNPPLPPNPDR